MSLFCFVRVGRASVVLLFRRWNGHFMPVVVFFFSLGFLFSFLLVFMPCSTCPGVSNCIGQLFYEDSLVQHRVSLKGRWEHTH